MLDVFCVLVCGVFLSAAEEGRAGFLVAWNFAFGTAVADVLLCFWSIAADENCKVVSLGVRRDNLTLFSIS